MFIVDYVHRDGMHTIHTQSPVIASAWVEFLVSLPDVWLVVVWGPL
jgi:hypothetical protein